MFEKTTQNHKKPPFSSNSRSVFFKKTKTQLHLFFREWSGKEDK
jgi:hypothetical protein